MQQGPEHCPLCESACSVPKPSAESISGQEFSYRSCLDCRTLFISPAPDEATLAAAYDDSYYGKEETKFLEPFETIIDRFRRGRARTVLKSVAPGAAVLDVGCGNGRFLGYLSEAGIDCTGVELPGKAAERAARIPGVRVLLGNLQTLGLPPQQFDAVTLWHVFEHLPEPRAVLREIHRLLKSGGLLYLSLPNARSWQAAVFGRYWLHLDPPRHLFLPGADALRRVVQDFGFSLVSEHHFSAEQNIFGIQQSALNLFRPRRDEVFEVLKGRNTSEMGVSKGALGAQLIFVAATLPLALSWALAEAAAKKGGTMTLVFRRGA